MKIAVFPGQGSQSIGMGLDYFHKFHMAKNLYKIAEEVSGINLQKIIFEGSEAELKSTKIAQLAIMLTEIIGLKVLEETAEKKLSAMVSFVAGHSLGEYSALVAAESLTFENAVHLLKIRGEAMEQAVPAGMGGMSAVIGVEDPKIIQEIAKKATIQTSKVCVVANHNAIGQIILSGEKEALQAAAEIAKNEFKVKIVKPLEVSGPFHSPLMEPARLKLQEALNKIEWRPLSIPLISNVTAETINISNIKDLLARQIVSEVKWVQSMQYAVKKGVNFLLEIGPNKVLSGLMKRIDSNVTCYNIEKAEDIAKYLNENH